MNTWQDNFKEYTTGAFVLHLTSNQCEMLMAFSENGNRIYHHNLSKSCDGRFVPIMNGLIRRGLVEHNSLWGKGYDCSREEFYRTYRLTDAGVLVRGLLIMAGREVKKTVTVNA